VADLVVLVMCTADRATAFPDTTAKEYLMGVLTFQVMSEDMGLIST